MTRLDSITNEALRTAALAVVTALYAFGGALGAAGIGVHGFKDASTLDKALGAGCAAGFPIVLDGVGRLKSWLESHRSTP